MHNKILQCWNLLNILIHRQIVRMLCFPQNEMHHSIYRVALVWMWLPAPAILVPANNTSVRPGCCNFASNSGSKRWRSDSRSWGTESTQHSLRVLFNLNVSCCVCVWRIKTYNSDVTHWISLWNDQNRDLVNTETVGNLLLHTSTKY